MAEQRIENISENIANNTPNPLFSDETEEVKRPSGDVEPELWNLEGEQTAANSHFDGSLENLREKYPQFYEQTMEYFSQNIFHGIKRDSDRLLKALKENSKES